MLPDSVRNLAQRKLDGDAIALAEEITRYVHSLDPPKLRHYCQVIWLQEVELEVDDPALYGFNAKVYDQVLTLQKNAPTCETTRLIKCATHICRLKRGTGFPRFRDRVLYVGKTLTEVFPITEQLKGRSYRTQVQGDLLRMCQAVYL